MNKEDYSNLPKSRKEALEVGSNKYYTGKPCKNGHDEPKYTDRSLCVRCNYERTRKYIKTHPTMQAKAQKRWYNSTPEHRLYTHAKHRKRSKELGFTLKENDITIPQKCPVFNIQIEPMKEKRSDSSPSIDRIDSTKGYHPDNVEIISWRANDIKGYGSLLEHLQVVSYMVNHKPKLNDEELRVLKEIMEKCDV